ncbi:pseudouridine synthase [Devosia algicola]|uniref:Pseudouridine synthase n=1 Tax=Devosia algicola TaxID=3026418 RepID=A0ABY7YMN3_9HYPH|nr:pseudouridine synthase [Devosia algicola]WDR02462.1 pseudouridine synthase [Devosia algicola]
MSETPATGDRLAKVIARSGLCSRRDAETWITAGRVEVNGKKVLTPAFNVTDRDKVIVDGAPLAARQGTRVWLYHKPAGLVVTEKDPEGRPTIFEALATHGLPRVVTVGRLDINTEGLLLLTNDGGLKRVLELPATGWLRRYRVRAHGVVTQAALDGLANGIEIEGIRYGAIEAKLEREQGANVWLTMALREGKNREVKNVLGALGLEVNRLIRVSYGPFQLADIPIGAVETVKARMLREQLGKRLAEEADVDFDSEMPGKEELVGKPTRDRLTGRGTNTVEIAKQRFRFTDSAEKTEREIREEKPRQDRPGRFGATRSAPPVKRFDDRDLGETAPHAKSSSTMAVRKTLSKKPMARSRDEAILAINHSARVGPAPMVSANPLMTSHAVRAATMSAAIAPNAHLRTSQNVISVTVRSGVPMANAPSVAPIPSGRPAPSRSAPAPTMNALSHPIR